jgi:hypothetical protein
MAGLVSAMSAARRASLMLEAGTAGEMQFANRLFRFAA